MSLCILQGGKLLVIAATGFTLSWTHSVQKTEWQEDWQAEESGLTIVEARVQGSGAGMEAGEGARFDGIWWHYRPTLAALPKLTLAQSGAAGSWWLCAAGACHELGGGAMAPPIELSYCTKREGG